MIDLCENDITPIITGYDINYEKQYVPNITYHQILIPKLKRKRKRKRKRKH